MTVNAKRLRLLAALVLSMAMLALLLRLGVWQIERAQFKETLAEQAQENAARSPLLAHEVIEESRTVSWHFRRARVVGRFDPERQYLLDNRTYDGRAGYYVLSVFQYGSHHLLVNRGWVPVGLDRNVLPDVRIDDRQVTLTGYLAALPASGLILGDSGYAQATWPKVVQVVEPNSMARQLGFALLPGVLLLDPTNPACLRCRWVVAEGISAERHRGYAVQWFALAAALVLLLAVASFIGIRRSAR